MLERKKWDSHALDTLKSKICQGKPYSQIAKEMGTSINVIRKMASKHGFKSPLAKIPWTEQEHAWLVENAPAVTCAEAAEYLGKSYNAVHLYANSRGIKFKLDLANLWSVEDIANLTRLHENQYTNEEIAKELGRSPYAVWNKKKQIGIKGNWRIHPKSKKRYLAEAWNESEVNSALSDLDVATAKRVAKELGRTPSSLYQKLQREELSVTQGRLSFKELALSIGMSHPNTLIRRAREAGVSSRRYNVKGEFSKPMLSDQDVVKILTNLLENPGTACFSYKKAQALLDYHKNLFEEFRR